MGVGQSQAPPTDEEMHKGEESALTTETNQSEQLPEQKKRKKKPGEVDEEKQTGNPDKDVKEGLMTNKKKNLDKEDPKDEADEKKDDDKEDAKESSLYQVRN